MAQRSVRAAIHKRRERVYVCVCVCVVTAAKVLLVSVRRDHKLETFPEPISLCK